MEPLTAADGYALLRLRIAREFGWTLNYIDGLSMAEIGRVTSWLSGQEKGRA